jgi:hypothetical protein
MSISPVSSAATAAPQANPAVNGTPFKRDRDGDYDNNAKETPQSEAVEASKGSMVLNIKA